MKPCCERDHDGDGNCDRHRLNNSIAALEDLRKLQEHEPAQATLDVVNALLMTCSALGGYAMGVVCADAWACGKEPTFEALDKAARRSAT